MTLKKTNKKIGLGMGLPAGEGLRRWWIWLLVVGVVGFVAYGQLSKSSGQTAEVPAKTKGPAPPPAIVVTAVAAKKGDINIYLTGLGNVTPLRTITVKSRVDGELMKVFYKEGQIVSKGAPLAEIDPRPYQAQLTQAEGQMIRDQALLKNAKLDLERYRVLSTQDSIAKQQYDTQKSLVRQLEGTVKFDQGQIDNAKLQIVYSHITAPVGGRIGLRVVDPGNIIRAADTTGLCVITQLEPITVVFTIAEDHLPPVLDQLRAGKRLEVEAFNREQTKKLATGHLLTTDNQIDVNSGTLRLKAEFANKDHKLFPNQFVNARLLLDTKRDITVVPTAAIQRSPQATFVYLVQADQTVAIRPVRLGPTEGDHTGIEDGLASGDLVVVEGVERLRQGSKVQLKDQGANNNSRKGK